MFNSLIEQYHYLGYEQPVGEHLKYLAWPHGRPVARMVWSPAPRHLDLLPGGALDSDGTYHGARQERPDPSRQPAGERGVRTPAAP